MRRIGGMLAGFIVLLSGGLLTGGCSEPVGERVEVGAPAPEFGAVDLQGDSVHLSNLRNRVVLLNVWATWCEPCREEIPALQALQERHASRGFEVVGVSIDFASEREKLRPFADSFGVTYTLWHDTDDTVTRVFRLAGAPATFLIDRDGIMRWRKMGPVQADDATLAAAIEAALAPS
jgi:cytochrome c biogenesis protein CcmG, thiol:disulfide interchange protein DsbE